MRNLEALRINFLFFHLFIYLLIYLFVHLFIYLFICLFLSILWWKTKDTMTNNFLTVDFKTFVLIRLSISIRNAFKWHITWPYLEKFQFFCSEPTAKIPPFWKYLKSGTCANNDDVHSSFFGPSWQVHIGFICKLWFFHGALFQS